MSLIEHITVCVCTFRRPALLKRLLDGVVAQESSNLFTYSVVVADNDSLESARELVCDMAKRSGIPIRYCVEPRQNIALARNKAVENAIGEFIAFIDDDEFPGTRWLITLFEACRRHSVDGVLGPVLPQFDEPPPQWVIKGQFYQRPTYPTGYVIDWRKGRTGNVLLSKRIFLGQTQPFNPEHLTGEDQEFFGRMIEEGYVFIWCDEALVFEVVPPVRWSRKFILKRTLFRGALSRIDRDFGSAQVLTSLLAVPIYIAILPLAVLVGQHKVMIYLEKLFYHVGRLVAVVGFTPIRTPYVTE